MSHSRVNNTVLARLDLYLQSMCVFCVGICVLVLLGWAFNTPALIRLFLFHATMKPLTAICIIFNAIALWLHRQKSKIALPEWYGTILGLVVVILSGLILLEYVFNVNLGVDLLFFKRAVLAENILNPGRPAPTTDICLLLSGLAIVSSRRSGWLLSMLIFPVMLVCLLAIVGYAYDVNSLYAVGFYNSMAFPTALLLFLLSLGLLAANPEYPLTKILISSLAGGSMVRRFLIVAVLAPFILGWLRLLGELLGWYGSRFGLALFATANIIVAVVLIFWSARLLNQSDERRETAYNTSEEHRSQLAGILDSAMDAIITIDNDQKVVIFNSAAEHMFDYKAQDILNKSIEVLLPERYRAIHREHIIHFGEKDVITRAMGAALPNTGVRANGQEFPIEASISQIEILGKKYFTVILRDITGRVAAEQELRDLERQYRLLVEEMPAIVYVDEYGGNWRYLSPQLKKITGYEVDEWISDPEMFRKLVPTEDLQQIDSAISQNLNEGNKFHYEFRLQAKDGNTLWMRDEVILRHEASSGKILLYGVFYDITSRKLAELEKERSEERFSKAFRSSPAGVTITTIANGTFLDVNESFLKMIEYERSEVIGHTSLELNLLDVDERSKSIQQLTEQGTVRNLELRMQAKSGRQLTVLFSTEMIEMDGLQYALATVLDITEMKSSQDRVAYQASLLANVNDAIVATDAQYRLTFWNDAAEKMYGWQRAEVLGSAGVDIIKTEFSDATAQEMRQRIKEMGRWRGEVTQLRRDGTRIFAEVSSIVMHNNNGQIAGYLSINRDITERKQAENALRTAEENYRQMLENIPAIVYLSDPMHTIGVTYVGPQIAALGFSQEEWIADPQLWVNQLYPGDRDWVLAKTRELDVTGMPFDVEYRIFTRDQKLRWFHDRAKYIIDSSNTRLYIQGFMVDITERKEVEKEREARLVLEAKNVELDRFAYTVSHDLKSPLTTITGFLNFLQTDVATANKDRVAHDIDRMEAAVNKLRIRLDKVLELSRAGVAINTPEEVSLKELVNETLELMTGPLETGGVKTTVAANLPVVMGDRTRLGQVIQNLIENGIKYRDLQKEPEIEIGWKGMDQNEFQILFIRDNGIGIPLESQQYIFELFKKINVNSEGSGVGLALVKRIIDVHGGRIWVESEPGMGSTFFFTLPSEPKTKSVL